MRISDWSSDVCSSDLASLISSLDGEEFLTGRQRPGPPGSHQACNLSPRTTSTRVADGPPRVIGVQGMDRAQKAEAVAELKQTFNEVAVVVVKIGRAHV